MGRRAVPEEEMKRRVNILISVLKEEDRNVYHREEYLTPVLER